MPATEASPEKPARNSEYALRVRLAYQLRRLRQQHGYTQRRLAQELKLSSAMVCAIECATRNVRLATAEAAVGLAEHYFDGKPVISTNPPAEIDMRLGVQRHSLRSLARATKEYRRRNGLTLREFSDMVGFSYGHMSRMNTESGVMSRKSAKRILDYMREHPDGRPRKQVTAAPPSAPVAEPAVESAAVDGSTPPTFVPEAKVLESIVYDGVTPHYFVKTPWGVAIMRAGK